LKLVRIIKNYQWNGYEITRQTPDGEGRWGEIQFTLEPVEKCDFVIVLNYSPEDVWVECPPANIWALMQEPNHPELMPWLAKGHDSFAKVFTPHAQGGDPKYVASQTCLPWFDYDRQCSYRDLLDRGVPMKTKILSWVTSALNHFPGHQPRLALLDHLRNEPRLSIDLFGRGIHPVDSKWDAIAPYKYSLAVENSHTLHYWTEKLADCFLAYTLPIYYGCTNLGDYFPPESYIAIDIRDPASSVDTILDAIHGQAWERRFDAICEARELVLKKHQLFPFIADRIEQTPWSAPQRICIRAYREERNEPAPPILHRPWWKQAIQTLTRR